MRRLVAVLAALAMGAGGVVAQGCGGSEGGSAVADPGAGQLEIIYVPAPGAKPRTGTLVCPATSADQQQACEEIESLTGAFDPVPSQTACTETYGGPDQMSLLGTWGGQRVRTTLSRTNGCEIERYEALAPVLLPLLAARKRG